MVGFVCFCFEFVGFDIWVCLLNRMIFVLSLVACIVVI